MNATGRGPRRRALGRLVAAVGFLVVAASALLAAGTRLPPLPGELDDLGPWLEQHGTAIAMAHALRAFGLVAVGYLAVLGTLFVLDARGRRRRAGRVLDALAPHRLRAGTARLLGTGLATGLTISALPVSAGAAPTPTTDTATSAPAPSDEIAVMIPLPRSAATETPTTSPTASPGVPPPRAAPSTTLRAHPPAEPSASRPGTELPAQRSPTSAPPERPSVPHALMRSIADEPPPASGPSPAPEPSPDAWDVELGDHLWSIAEEVVGEAEGRSDDATVARYWRRLIDANRDRLVDPDNPDLLFPGQRLRLPEISAG